jgi:hypothetical protein
MSRRSLIGDRPTSVRDAERWVRTGDDGMSTEAAAAGKRHPARLTIEVTQELRGHIKIAAFKRGCTVAALLRQMLQREFGDTPESKP